MWYLHKGAKVDNQILPNGIQWLDEKKWAQIEIKEVPCKRKGKQIFFPLYSEVGETLGQISHNPWKLPSVEMFSIWLDVVLGSLLELSQWSQAIPASLHLLWFSDLLAL